MAARASRGALSCATLLLVLLAGHGVAAAPADTVPFRIVHGRPELANEAAVLCYVWSEGGRLHLRLLPGTARQRVRGELRTSREGSFRDVTPLSEDILVKQSKPSKLAFETRTGGKQEGLDVTLAGDFNQLTIDLLVDDVRHPDAVRIGARSARPRGLPVRLDVKGADPTWIARFGF